MRLIEFCCRIIEKQARARLRICREQLELPDQQCRCEQLLLSTGNMILRTDAIELNGQLRSMRPHLGTTPLVICRPTLLERLGEIEMPRPTGPIAQREFPIEEAARESLDLFAEARHIAKPGIRDFLPIAHQFHIPDANQGPGLSSLERRVSLTQYLRIALPVRNEAWFHVEHAPVKIAAAPTRSLLDEFMDFRVNDLNRQQQREIRQ